MSRLAPAVLAVLSCLALAACVRRPTCESGRRARRGAICGDQHVGACVLDDEECAFDPAAGETRCVGDDGETRVADTPWCDRERHVVCAVLLAHDRSSRTPRPVCLPTSPP